MKIQQRNEQGKNNREMNKEKEMNNANTEKKWTTYKQKRN